MAEIDVYHPGLTAGDPDDWHVRLRLTERDLRAMDAEDLERIVQAVRASIVGLVGEIRPPRHPPAPGQRYDAEATAVDDDAADPAPATILLDGPANLLALERDEHRLHHERHPS